MSQDFLLPHPDCYQIPGSRVIAGQYPFHPDPALGRAKLGRVLDAGVTAFIDLTEAGESPRSYAPVLYEEALARDREVAYHRFPMVDSDVPTPRRMAEILDCISAAEKTRQTVYLHCRNGIGRTGTVVGCYLVRAGFSGERALAQVRRLVDTVSDAETEQHERNGYPQTEPQREFVRRWAECDPDAIGHESRDLRATPRMEQPSEERAGASDVTCSMEQEQEETFRVDIDAVLRELEGDRTDTPAKLLPVICAALDERVMPYEVEEEHSCVRLEIRGREATYSSLLLANEEKGLVSCYVRLPSWVPEASRTAMCEALARANYALPVGNFEMDVNDGELRYKSGMDVEGGELVPRMVHNLFIAAVAMCNQYHPAFMRVIYGGATPEEAIAEVES